MDSLENIELVIFAGGLGSRLSDYTTTIPKPLVEVGGMPIIWHIMKIYHTFGVKNFKILLGNKGNLIKKFFIDYNINQNHISVDTINNSYNLIKSKKKNIENWKVELYDTGLESLTAKRLKLVEKYIKSENFLLTYGDAVATIDILKLYKHHMKSKKSITLSAVKTPPRFGKLNFKGKKLKFAEKELSNDDLINGGYFVVNKKVLKTIKGNVSFENGPLKILFEKNDVNVYKHNGFWGCMDTLADKDNLEKIWESKNNWNNWEKKKKF